MLAKYLYPEDLTVATSGPSALFLRGANSWFSLFLEGRSSRFEGWFLAATDSQPHRYAKVLERVYRVDQDQQELIPTGISLNLDQVTLYYQDDLWLRFKTLPFSLESNANGLSIEGAPGLTYCLNLDPRGIYQTPEWGRQILQSSTLIEYEDPLLAQPLFISSTNDKLSTSLNWQSVSYPRDLERHSDPTALYVITLKAISGRIDLGIGWDQTSAKNSQTAAAALQFDLQPKPDPSELSQPSPQWHKVAQSWTAAALSYLETPTGYYAGLPWFHQVWSRDELLIGLGLPAPKQLAMIERYFSLPLQNGELPTFLNSGTTCADGVGWLALLIKEYGLSKLSLSQQTTAKQFLTQAVLGLREHRQAANGLIYSGYNSTWMDTIGRTGYRVEIQAMFSLTLKLLAQLEPSNLEWQRWQKQLQSSCRKHLIWKDPKTGQGSVILDGLTDSQNPDPLIRPNTLLAYLIDPNLFPKEAWDRSFELTIEACATDWGGLSSVEHSASIFRPRSSGQDNQSYHNGDSWFFVNNLAALALDRFQANSYADSISQLLASSAAETLTQHFLGYPGEIASAQNGASWGTGIHGFSGGGYLLSLNQIYKQT